MDAVGIIAEYNPFHSGHEFLLNQARLISQNKPIVVLMSGNYVQRGQISICDKWSRAKSALLSGADLVFELPFSYAVQPADIFACGSMKILEQLGVSDLVFGVEDDQIDYMNLGGKISKLAQSSHIFKDYTQTYSTQYNQMLIEQIGYDLTQPNITLAVAYAVANCSLSRPLHLHAIKRFGSGGHNDKYIQDIVASATAIRRKILYELNGDFSKLENYLPKEELLWLSKQTVFPNWEMMFPFLKYRLESTNISHLQSIYQMSEGLEYKMKAEIHQSHNFEDFLHKIKSKRYTYARLRRLCLYTLLDITCDDIEEANQIITPMLLGYSLRGRKYLKKIRKSTNLPIISKVDKKNSEIGSLRLQIKVDRFFEQLIGYDQNFGRKPFEVR
ncbi:nucleotidyltransferase [Lactobacillus iners]|uniref:nucleotidyltransferase n=1 Tax=Lactobacillus iners TaxID=147802 RepID=UPI000C99F7AD|nr:nucleotidyltransferase [Lactobacillus iners]MDK8317128.1 nucleotidyltransferase [Lactobacillus iners]MDK8324335.1 nucleotidyltransferase [Lactobacillus iners]MDK8581838.1 nucleotidyltransferase [Lactobacillus iners]PMC47082.1 nucleotidyltransferase [Lactobacillus iners]